MKYFVLVHFLVSVWSKDCQERVLNPNAQAFEECVTSASILGDAKADKSTWLLQHAARPQKRQECQIPAEAKFYSQSAEDRILYEALFCNKQDGIFVELGALDGTRFSNTKFFEETMGWKGALIEASPRSVEALKRNRRNPRNIIIPEAICAEGVGHVDFVMGRSAATDGITKNMAVTFKKKFHSHGRREIQVSVPCRPLGSMLWDLAKHTGIYHVDFFSLDVEGSELVVLETNDWRVPVHYFMVEMDGRNATKDEAVRQLLYRRSYVQAAVNVPRSEVFKLQQP